MPEADSSILAALFAVFYVSLAIAASGHAILKKEDSRAAVAWVGVIWLAPLMGSLLYLMFGINRIRRRAAELRGEMPRVDQGSAVRAYVPEDMGRELPREMQALARLADRVSRQPLLTGNRLTPLSNGDKAYPRMLEAIASARQSITLSTYIFSNDAVGRDFARSLGQAVRRGVSVRVLVDAVGLRYSIPSIIRHLRRERVPYARFMPTRTPLAMPFMNLRNHRKLLVVDGLLGFSGGMNIAAGNCVESQPRHPIRDLHFAIEGPVVAELQTVFAEDWDFACRERLNGERWFPKPYAPGSTLSRVIPDGPDENLDTLRQVIVGALSVARRHVRVMTPYFLPDATVQDALKTAALRGATVDVVLPLRNNLPMVDWACRGQLEDLLQWGVRVWYSPGDFDHSKLFTVDGRWSMVGSANWDPRSLRLNFECNLECYDARLARSLERMVDQVTARAEPLELAELRNAWLPVRLRNGIAKLMSPYL
ncbi:cardiolipin synthase [Halovibrio salipaludis]|uniref:Cardiolipin synthase n=1 Tax=Halovibrio salipaludis TaxID=2032626 RepID=A0A2A2FBG2_9GAMM|nr:phospholipase D-like domain-containing protein [Halovibrio salipaludis]PAU82064.1 cardiolipin synthase [Halovibrio salipaludis]